MKELLIIGPCCYPTTKPAEFLLKSAHRNEAEIWLYGLGEDFIPHGADAQVVKLLRELKRFEHEYRYVLVTDVADVLILAHPDEILTKFLMSDTRLLMSAEREHWPEQGLGESFPKVIGGYRYLNAGQYVGEIKYVMTCLEWMISRYRGVVEGMDNSQPWWAQMYVRGEVKFKIDHECSVFQSMSGGADGHVRKLPGMRRITNDATGSMPCLVHFNGRCGNDLPYQEMYRRLFQDEQT